MSDLPPQEYIHCPYLGKVDDRGEVYNQPTRRNRCYRWERALPIKRQDQEQYCLSPLHVTCPRHTEPGALPVPDVRRRGRRRGALRVLGIPLRRFVGYMAPMLLLFVAAIAASYVLVRNMTADPLPTRLAAAAETRLAGTPTATPTPFPTWTATATDTPTVTSTAPLVVLPSDTPTLTPTAGFATATPTLMLYETPWPTTPAATGTFDSPLATPTVVADSGTFNSPLGTPTAPGMDTPAVPTSTPYPPTSNGTSPTGTPVPTATPTSSPYDFVVYGEPVRTLLPSGVDVCAKVYGRVLDRHGNNITNTVAMIVEWWPNNKLMVGAPGWPPIKPDGTYEFCLTRGQFNLSVVAAKRISQVLWIDLDEPNFKGQVVLEVNFQLVK